MPKVNVKTKLSYWKPARKFPEHYPGECPDHSYFLLDQNVFPISVNDEKQLIIHGDDEMCSGKEVNTILKNLNLPPLEERFPVLAYGANRNPATLYIKLHNYGYNTKSVWAIPMLRGYIKDADVIAAGLYGQGYFYGDLLIDSPFTKGCLTEVWIGLLDHDQLRVMNDSEGIKTDLYSLVIFPNVFIEQYQKEINLLGYASQKPVAISDTYQTPIAFKNILAKNRRIPSMTAIEMIQHFIEVLHIEEQISKITGISVNQKLPHELSKYLNGQWWNHFNTGMTPIKGYGEILDLFNSNVKVLSSEYSTAKKMAHKGLSISKDEAYRLGDNYKFSKLIV